MNVLLFRSRGRRLLRDHGPAAAVALAVLAVWAGVSGLLLADKPYLLPGPLAVATAAARNIGLVGAATLTTLTEALCGYAGAALLGLAAAALMSQFAALRRGIYPYAVLLQTIPVITIAPAIVLWLGYGIVSVTVISLVMSVFPILNSALTGLRSTPRTLVELFAMHHARPRTLFWRLRLPYALPSVLAGLRTAAGLSVVGAIVGEFVIGSGSARPGLGVEIIFAQGKLYTALLFVEVIAAAMLGLVFFQAVEIAGHLLLRHWHESARES